MQDPATSSLVRAIHDSPAGAALVIAGAGSRALAWLLAEPGASRTVLDAQIPYATPALDEYVGRAAAQHVSAEEAAAMADAAYWRGLYIDALARPSRIGCRSIVGVACTATIATDRPKRGAHRCHVATRWSGGVAVRSLTLTKGARDRSGEEEVVSRLVLNALAAAVAPGAQTLDLGLLSTDALAESTARVDDGIARVARGRQSVAELRTDGAISDGARGGRAVLAGSFNPIHAGHERLLKAAARLTGLEPALELSVVNVDKPPLPLSVVEARVAQVRGAYPVIVTRAPTFAEKARLLPGAVFVVGYDTAVRLFDERYYPPYDPGRDPGAAGSASGVAMAAIRCYGCRFLVAGRVAGGRFRTLRDIEVPPRFRDLIDEIPAERFRKDVSSTQLRLSRSAGGAG